MYSAANGWIREDRRRALNGVCKARGRICGRVNPFPTPLLSLLDWKGEEDGRSGGGHWTSVVAHIILFSPMKKKRPFPGIRVYLSPEENYRGRVLSIYSRDGKTQPFKLIDPVCMPTRDPTHMTSGKTRRRRSIDRVKWNGGEGFLSSRPIAQINSFVEGGIRPRVGME